MDYLELLGTFEGLVKSREAELSALVKLQEQDWSDVRRNQKVKSLEEFTTTYRKLVEGFKDYEEL